MTLTVDETRVVRDDGSLVTVCDVFHGDSGCSCGCHRGPCQRAAAVDDVRRHGTKQGEELPWERAS